MSENSGRVTPLDWRQLVDEALRRRKAENLTRREHAALASVSIPTLAAFDRGERTLSLAKAFDILRVVGLVDEGDSDGAQEVFVRDAFARWRFLTSKLPTNSPARFRHGWYRFDYALVGNVKMPDLPRLLGMIKKAEVRHTGWPMFITLERAEFAPRESDGVLECWVKLGDDDVDRRFTDPAHTDFWRAAPAGRFFLIRGYAEDSEETVRPGTILDTTVHIWRLAEALMHAARVGLAMKKQSSDDITVHFRALYSGLAGRLLRSLGSPANPFDTLHLARSDEALIEAIVSAQSIEDDLAGTVYPLVASLYERFGVANLSGELVQAEVARFREGEF
jgi:transcriptional regulator with XRE-family HTH domain